MFQAMSACLRNLAQDFQTVKFCQILGSAAGLSKHFKVFILIYIDLSNIFFVQWFLIPNQIYELWVCYGLGYYSAYILIWSLLEMYFVKSL